MKLRFLVGLVLCTGCVAWADRIQAVQYWGSDPIATTSGGVVIQYVVLWGEFSPGKEYAVTCQDQSIQGSIRRLYPSTVTVESNQINLAFARANFAKETVCDTWSYDQLGGPESTPASNRCRFPLSPVVYESQRLPDAGTRCD